MASFDLRHAGDVDPALAAIDSGFNDDRCFLTGVCCCGAWSTSVIVAVAVVAEGADSAGSEIVGGGGAFVFAGGALAPSNSVDDGGCEEDMLGEGGAGESSVASSGSGNAVAGAFVRTASITSRSDLILLSCTDTFFLGDLLRDFSWSDVIPPVDSSNTTQLVSSKSLSEDVGSVG